MGGGLGGPVPKDLLVIAGVMLLTLLLANSSAFLIPLLLSLTPAVWQKGFVWQLATYPYIETGPPTFWFVVSLVLLLLYGRDVFNGLGRRHFWRMVLWSTVGAAILATAVDFLMDLAGAAGPLRLTMMQSWVLPAALLAAWARAHRGATILFMFILPIEAGWFIALELVFAFLGLIRTHDLAGFLGICAAIGIAWGYIARSGRIGFSKRDLRETRLRIERWWIQRKLDQAKKKRKLRVVPGDKDRGGDVRRGPWVN